jgi:DHA1 family inner membrane transport protein
LLGGVAIRQGLGWTSTGPVGAALAFAGFLIWIVAWREAGSSPVEPAAENDATSPTPAPRQPAPPLAPDHRCRTGVPGDTVA